MVLAEPRHEPVWQGRGQTIHAPLEEADWQRRSAGPGSKDPRGYEWHWVWSDTDPDTP